MSAHKYELMMIVDPQMEDNSVKKLVERHMETVTKENGTLDNADYWGRRKLAYEINGNREGQYVVVEYTCEPAVSDELDRRMKLDDSIIRTKILRKDVK